jgi:septal ring factor EnvC (AmiA/AmiB activator)
MAHIDELIRRVEGEREALREDRRVIKKTRHGSAEAIANRNRRALDRFPQLVEALAALCEAIEGLRQTAAADLALQQKLGNVQAEYAALCEKTAAHAAALAEVERAVRDRNRDIEQLKNKLRETAEENRTLREQNAKLRERVKTLRGRQP